MKKLKRIELVFENCESVEIYGEDIVRLYVDDISSSLYKSPYDNLIGDFNSCKEFCIEISKNSNTTYDSFGEKSKKTIFERIMEFSDIVSFEILYVDNEEIAISVPWNKASDEINYWQIQNIGKNGNIRILISTQKTMDDLIDIFGE